MRKCEIIFVSSVQPRKEMDANDIACRFLLASITFPEISSSSNARQTTHRTRDTSRRYLYLDTWIKSSVKVYTLGSALLRERSARALGLPLLGRSSRANEKFNRDSFARLNVTSAIHGRSERGQDRDNGVSGNEGVQDGASGTSRAPSNDACDTDEGQRKEGRKRIQNEKTGTKGRSAGPQISPVIVSQSLAESRQTIHRRRAETSSFA